MVPVICVLYHMAHLRIMVDSHNPGLPYAEYSWDGASAVYEAIVSNRQIPIGRQDHRNISAFRFLGAALVGFTAGKSGATGSEDLVVAKLPSWM